MDEMDHPIPEAAPSGRRRIAAGIPLDAIQHPLDRAAIQALQNVVGFDDLVRALFEYGVERLERITNLSSAVRVGPQQFPDLYRMYQRCVIRMGVYPEPPLYLRSGGINAMTGGVEAPYIVLTSGLVSSASTPELEYVIGHELGHIRCQHLLYGTLSRLLPILSAQIPVIGKIVGTGISVALMEWYRRAELSCDRFGLLCVQQLDPALRVHMKLAGVPYALYEQMNVDAFLQQYEEFEVLDQDRLSMLYKILAQLEMSHPWLVVRAHRLKSWWDQGEPQRLLEEAPWEVEDVSRACSVCKSVCPVGDRFCEKCGTPLEGA
jgi:Zn-dependent protease with chaperone function